MELLFVYFNILNAVHYLKIIESYDDNIYVVTAYLELYLLQL